MTIDRAITILRQVLNEYNDDRERNGADPYYESIEALDTLIREANKKK